MDVRAELQEISEAKANEIVHARPSAPGMAAVQRDGFRLYFSLLSLAQAAAQSCRGAELKLC